MKSANHGKPLRKQKGRLAEDDAKADPRELHHNVTKHTPTLPEHHTMWHSLIRNLATILAISSICCSFQFTLPGN